MPASGSCLTGPSSPEGWPCRYRLSLSPCTIPPPNQHFDLTCGTGAAVGNTRSQVTIAIHYVVELPVGVRLYACRAGEQRPHAGPVMLPHHVLPLWYCRMTCVFASTHMTMQAMHDCLLSHFLPMMGAAACQSNVVGLCASVRSLRAARCGSVIFAAHRPSRTPSFPARISKTPAF